MLLAIDASNTNLKFGVFEGERLLHDWRLATRGEAMADELGILFLQLIREVGIDPARIDAVVIASVVPTLNASLIEASEHYFNCPPLMVGPGMKSGLKILYENPKEVGADRIANAVAAYELYGGPSIVVDFGTATTLDAVSPRGEYLGGAIIPGIEVSMDALFGRAAGLRKVELVPPRNVIGKSTVESIQSGAIYGFTGQVDHLVRCFIHELGDSTVVATGGLASLIAPLSTTIQHQEPWLTLYGLRIVYERNR